MRIADIDAIGADLAALSRLSGVPVLWRCHTSDEPIRRLGEQRVHHCNPFCTAVKSEPLRHGRCRVAESTDLIAESLRRRGPWSKRCHAGVVELVVPILAGGRFLGALLAGPWREPAGTLLCRGEGARLPLLDESRVADLASCLALAAARIASLAVPPVPRDARVERALRWIDRHFAARSVVPAVSRECGLSPSRLAHLVRAQTGRSLVQLVAERRVEEARRLLMGGDLGLREVALAAGFADQSHLGLVFRRLTGMTPRRFRLVGGA